MPSMGAKNGSAGPPARRVRATGLWRWPTDSSGTLVEELDGGTILFEGHWFVCAHTLR